MKKVLVVVNHFAPYRDDTFKVLQDSHESEILFLLGEGNTTHKEWEYKEPLFSSYSASKAYQIRGLGVVYKEYMELLHKFKPDVVVLGGNLLSVLYTRFLYPKIRLIYSADTIYSGKRTEKGIGRYILSWLYRQADGIWTTGIAGEKYFRRYVEDSVPIRHGAYTNDIKRIKTNCKKYNRDYERNRLEILQSDVCFLFVGKLIESRRIDRILEIARLVSEREMKAKFLIVGDGPEIYKVEEYRKKYRNVVHIPFVTINELERVYVASDAYIYLGWEPYSLALYEAAILGLPIIANQEIGACYDCVWHEQSGYLLPEYDKAVIAEQVQAVIEGKYKAGAERLAEYLEKNRGVDWAAAQLAQLFKE